MSTKKKKDANGILWEYPSTVANELTAKQERANTHCSVSLNLHTSETAYFTFTNGINIKVDDLCVFKHFSSVNSVACCFEVVFPTHQFGVLIYFS